MAKPLPKYGALDRMEIEFAGPDVVAMARALHRQVGMLRGAIDVEAVAYALDVCEIRLEPLDNIEGALLTTPEKSAGSILVNRRSAPRRRRFTIAHELCHVLHTHHRPQRQVGFLCSSEDIRVRSHVLRPGLTRHERQEWQANRFAIEMLVPEHLLAPYLDVEPNLEIVLDVADEFAVSREAAARHFIEKSDRPLAMVFSHNGRVRYAVCDEEFPPLGLQRGDQLAAHVGNVGELSDLEIGDASDWLRRPNDATLACQTLAQQNNHAMTLLTLEDTEEVPPPPMFRRSARKR